eukprot:6186529-Pleurochrysis_carterae.AAC.2
MAAKVPAKVPDRIQGCDVRQGRLMGKNRAKDGVSASSPCACPHQHRATWFWDHSLCTCKLERCACDFRPKKSIREHVVPGQNSATNLILHGLGRLEPVDIVVVNALSLRDDVILNSVVNTNFSMRAVTWSKDICPALYRQQLGLDCDCSLCVILHTNMEADASKPHFDAVSVLPKHISDAEFVDLLDACTDPLACDTSTCNLTG